MLKFAEIPPVSNTVIVINVNQRSVFASYKDKIPESYNIYRIISLIVFKALIQATAFNHTR